MANGYEQPILRHIAAISRYNPERKLSPLGFMQMVLSTMQGRAELQPINKDRYDSGHDRDLKVWYRSRPLKSEVRTEESGCEKATIPARKEFTIPGLNYCEVSFWMPDSLIRQYEKDASQKVSIDSNTGRVVGFAGNTSVMKEVYDNLVDYAAVLLAKENELLVTQMGTMFGNNVTTGDSNAKALTFNIGTIALQDALIQLMSDWRKNEIDADGISIVGNGPFSDWEFVRKVYSNMPNTQGINMQAFQNMLPNVWYDKETTNIWGANHCGVFEKGSIELLTRNKYVGNFKSKLANSTYFTMSLPVNELLIPQQYIDRLLIDVQIREIDCATELEIDGVPTTVSEGVQVILKRRSSLFTWPDMYKNGDPLQNVNGTLRYALTATT